MSLNQVIKKVDEVTSFVVDFSDTDSWISGATIATATIKAYDIATNEIDNSLLSDTTGVVSDATVTGQLTGGAGGKFYKVIVTTNWDNGEVLQDSIEVMIDV